MSREYDFAPETPRTVDTSEGDTPRPADNSEGLMTPRLLEQVPKQRSPPAGVPALNLSGAGLGGGPAVSHAGEDGSNTWRALGDPDDVVEESDPTSARLQNAGGMMDFF